MTQRRVAPLAKRLVEERVQMLVEPLADGVLAKVSEWRIADVMHQAGHLDERLQCALQPIEPDLAGPLTELLVQGAHDETPGLLHFQRMCQPAAYRRIALEREHLGFCCSRRTRRS